MFTAMFVLLFCYLYTWTASRLSRCSTSQCYHCKKYVDNKQYVAWWWLDKEPAEMIVIIRQMMQIDKVGTWRWWGGWLFFSDAESAHRHTSVPIFHYVGHTTPFITTNIKPAQIQHKIEQHMNKYEMTRTWRISAWLHYKKNNLLLGQIKMTGEWWSAF